MKYVPYICLAGVALIAVLLVLLLPKDKPLTISATDVSLSVGESKTLDYEISESFAIVKPDVANPTIAKIERNKIVGVAAGETSITLVAEYNGKTAECSFKVVVTRNSEEQSPSEIPEVQTPPEETKDEPTQTPEDNPKEESGTPVDGEKGNEANNGNSENSGPNDPNDDESELKFSITPEINCKYEDNVFVVSSGKSAYFNIVFDLNENDKYFQVIAAGEYSLTSSTATISRTTSGVGWEISASESGTIGVLIDGKVICTFAFIVN